ncbi:hypothetical protein ABC502_13680 [Alkalimonas sp. NCh-2]|uniref:hypothetical protein n=1 Tax=Alkalimonas sp. NCh-2 TaxID=3144846 RepID=UPI0031F6A2B1
MLKSLISFLALIWPFWLCANPSVMKMAVLEYYPRCDYKVISSINQQMEQASSSEQLHEESASLLQALVQKLKAEAQSVGADAIILNSVSQLRVHDAPTVPSSDVLKNRRARRQNNSQANSMTLWASINADFIQLCEEDPTLPRKNTPFDAAGVDLNNKQSLTFEISFSADTQITSTEKEGTRPLSDTLGLKQGFYGIKLGISPENLVAWLGPTSVELHLENNAKALAYGRNHWFYFIDNQLVRMEIGNRHLSALAEGMIPADAYFDDIQRWQLDGKFSYGSTLETLQAHYTDSLQQLAADRFALSHQQHQLELYFVNYLNIASGKQEAKLNKVVLRDTQLDHEGYQLSYLPEAKLLEILQSFSLDHELEEIMGHILPKLRASHHLQLRGAERLYVLSPNFAMQFDGSKPRTLLFQPVLIGDAHAQPLSRLLAEAGLPGTLQQFRNKYQDSVFSFEQDIYYINNYDLVLQYDDEDSILSLRIRSY